MRRLSWLQSAAAGVAAVGLTLPPGVLTAGEPARTTAASPANPSAQIVDVSLAGGGVLRGQVVDSAGAPLGATLVSVRSARGQALQGITDDQGKFELRGLDGGLYEVQAAGRGGVFRVWAGGASPPGAVDRVLLVAGGPVARGQWSGGPGPTSHPGYRQGGRFFGGQGAFWGGVIILGSLGGIVAGGILTGEQSGPPAS